LELPTDATPEAIEIAWRALLRRHHPDIAGPDGLEDAKRINVAHDWLGDPVLRTRYDRERGIRAGRPSRRGSSWRETHGARPTEATPARPRPRRPEDVVARFLDRVATLHADDLDRMAMADPAPIAFGATIRRFLPDDRLAAMEAIDAEIDRRLPPAAMARHGIATPSMPTPPSRPAFLDALLSEPFRARTRERLCRGWEAAVDQPRYGPNGDAVRALLGRLRSLDPAGVVSLARQGARDRLGDDPWPAGTSPEDDEVLRSFGAAARDASDQASNLDGRAVDRARRAAARIAHLLVRHAFAPEPDALTAPASGAGHERPVGPRRPAFTSRVSHQPDLAAAASAADAARMPCSRQGRGSSRSGPSSRSLPCVVVVRARRIVKRVRTDRCASPSDLVIAVGWLRSRNDLLEDELA
jgi:curved DNA-binding protein CbpA